MTRPNLPLASGPAGMLVAGRFTGDSPSPGSLLAITATSDQTLQAVGLTHEQYTGDAFTRLKRLGRLIDQGRLDDELRWRPAEVAA